MLYATKSHNSIMALDATQFSSIGQAVSEIFIFVLFFILFYFF